MRIRYHIGTVITCGVLIFNYGKYKIVCARRQSIFVVTLELFRRISKEESLAFIVISVVEHDSTVDQNVASCHE